MPTRSKLQFTLAATALALRLGALPVGAAAAKDSLLHGSWVLEETNDRGYIQLNLRPSPGGRYQGSWGRWVPDSAARGLRADAFRVPGPVSFEITRDAGTFTCRGVMEKGGGEGSFEFRPDLEFARTLERRGVGRPDAQQQLALALADMGTAALDALEAGGYPTPRVEKLVTLGEHGVNDQFVRGLTAAGYRLKTLERLLEARDHGVTAEFARELEDSGLADLDYDRLLEARDHGVTGEFIGELADAGYPRLTYQQLLRARDHGVDAEFIAGLESAGFRGLPIAAVVRARDHGLDERRARKARAALGADATIEEAIAWVDRGGR
jgi:hypothetical protein